MTAVHTSSNQDLNAPPSIAIITICLNDLPGLKATHESVRQQVCLPTQWIVIDGGSVDGTREWLRDIDWPPLAWTSEPDGGIYFAMNKGIKGCVADYILFLNSGDTLVDSEVLQHVSNALTGSNPPPTLLYGDCFDVDERGDAWYRRARPRHWALIGMPTSHQAMFFRRIAFSEGFDTNYRLAADYAAVLRLYARQRGSDFAYLPKALCRFHLGGISDVQRRSCIREEFTMRRQVLGLVPAIMLHVAHIVHAWIKRKMPAIHRRLRYD